jgi:nickel-dependent lactate racemase
MATIRIPYETAEEHGVFIPVEIPDQNLAKSFVPKEPGKIQDVEAALLRAVENPISGKTFSELLGAGKKIVFITENQFRAAPANQLLLPLLRKAKASGANISVVIGCGKVPPLSPDEIELKLGKEVVEMGVPIACNDIGRAEDYAFIGNTTAGTPVWVLKSVAQADVVITISTTQATLWGYGGSGMIIPAVSSNATIETNHVMSLAPDCVPGNNACRMQLDKYEALKIAGVDMGINVIIANNWDLVFINAGEPVASHQEAVGHYREIYEFEVGKDEKFDIVIAGSTAPTDHLFFHTSWAIVNCEPLTKKGGSIIFCSPCPGYGDWPGFALMDLMKDFMPPTPDHHAKAMNAFFSRERELWAGCIWYPIFRTMLNRDVQIVTREENVKVARDLGFEAQDSFDEAFAKAMAKHGKGARIAFVPFGRYSVFKS